MPGLFHSNPKGWVFVIFEKSKDIVYYINSLLTRKSQLDSCRKSRTHCHSFMVLNRMSELSAADWLSQTGVKKLIIATFHVW